MNYDKIKIRYYESVYFLAPNYLFHFIKTAENSETMNYEDPFPNPRVINKINAIAVTKDGRGDRVGVAKTRSLEL